MQSETKQYQKVRVWSRERLTARPSKETGDSCLKNPQTPWKFSAKPSHRKSEGGTWLVVANFLGSDPLFFRSRCSYKLPPKHMLLFVLTRKGRRGIYFCLLACLWLWTLKCCRQSNIVAPHFTCSRTQGLTFILQGPALAKAIFRPVPCPAWRAAVHGVPNSGTPFGDLSPAQEHSTHAVRVLPAMLRPRWWGRSQLAVLSGPGPQTLPSCHHWGSQAPRTQPDLRLLSLPKRGHVPSTVSQDDCLPPLGRRGWGRGSPPLQGLDPPSGRP